MSETEQTSREDRYEDVDTSHLAGLEDGCGCTEIWEHTSDREAEAADADERAEADTSDEQPEA